MASVMDFGSSSLGWRPNLGHCDMFLSKTLLSHTTSTYLGVKTSGTALMQWKHGTMSRDTEKTQGTNRINTFVDYSLFPAVNVNSSVRV